MSTVFQVIRERFSGRWLLAACLIGLMLSGMVIARVSPDTLVRDCERLIQDIQGQGFKGMALFAGVQLIVAVSGILPASLLGVAAGAVYGVSVGFLFSAVSIMAGADLAFLLSRSLFRPAISRLMSGRPKISNLDQMIAQDGWKLVCLLRISPVMPFSVTSYILGLSQIKHTDYVLGTLASLPALLGYVVMGSLTDEGLSAWAEGGTPIRWILLVIGGLATIALTIRLGQIFIKLGLPLQVSEKDMKPSTFSAFNGCSQKVLDYFVVLSPVFLVIALIFWSYTGTRGTDDLEYAGLAYSMLDPSQSIGEPGHHAGRVGLTLPLAAVFSLFGVSDGSLSLLTILSTILTTALLAKLTQMLFGNLAAIIAGWLYVFFPPTIDLATMFIPEPLVNLELTLASLLFLSAHNHVSGAATKYFFAGLLVGAAYLSTESGLLMIGVFAIYLLVNRQFRLAHLGVLGGFLFVLGAELLGHAIIHGNPFYRYSLGGKYIEDPMLVSSNVDLFYRLFKAYPSYFVYPNLEFGIFGHLLLLGGVYGLVNFQKCSFFVIWAAVIFVFYNFMSVSLSHYVALPVASRLITPGCVPLLILAGLALSDLWQVLKRVALPKFRAFMLMTVTFMLGCQFLVSLACLDLDGKRPGKTSLMAGNIELVSKYLESIPAFTLISDKRSIQLFKFYRQFNPQDNYINVALAEHALSQESLPSLPKPVFMLLNMPLLYEKELTGRSYWGGRELGIDTSTVISLALHCKEIFSTTIDRGKPMLANILGDDWLEKGLHMKGDGFNRNADFTQVKLFECHNPV